MTDLVLSSNKRVPVIALLILAASVVPFLVPAGYLLHLLVLFLIFSILALSVSLIVGFLGELTFGQAGFFAIGAYASALLTIDLGWPFWLSLPTAGLAAGLVGILVGIPSFRLQGPYFAIVTLGFSQIIALIITNSISITRGPMGISRIPPPEVSLPFLPEVTFNSELSYYFLAFGLLLATIYVVHRLLASRSGRAIVAIRENPALAQSIGVDLYRYKIFAFFVSTCIAGVSGAAYAHYVRVITPHLAETYYTTAALVMVVVGGAGTIAGAIVGAFIFTVIPEALRFMEDARMLVFGVILILSIRYMPRGIWPALVNLASRYARRMRPADDEVRK